MSQPDAKLQCSSPGEENSPHSAAPLNVDTSAISVFEVVFRHACPASEVTSELASKRQGFGLAWLLFDFIKKGRCRIPIPSLDLSGFSLSAGKLDLLLRSVPSALVETLRCGPYVCKNAALPVLLSFLQRIREEGNEGTRGNSLRSLNLAQCDSDEASVAIVQSLPRSVESLDLSGNRLRGASMETLCSASQTGGLPTLLPTLLHLDLSDNPLGPSGVTTVAQSLSSPLSPSAVIPLQSLKLARTRAKAKGVEALGKALQTRKLLSLQTLDLEGNEG
eukprot:Cvel_16899.t1-p1 / transcript=Cvel_16899.t1 / gene=Cvel_16899 / organism=Chromera_velia_CCMP2878 / gene_product=hypothetical protein / transcript_product=hypothetical protein / location=Cvel_scaffold1323:1-2545(-) / protein_length=276 / sequence_SO=supercontig / SO=protein_coding / is_pseudo=false